MRKAAGVVLVASVLAGVTSLAQQAAPYYLTGNIKEAPGTVTTDRGDQRTTFSGLIGFKVIPTEKGLEFTLFELSLVSKGVPTGRGETGVLGVDLIDDDIAWYDAKTGRASCAPTLTLHDELIDRGKGFRTAKAQPETDVFAPFTETMTGKMSARFPEALKVAEKGSTHVTWR